MDGNQFEQFVAQMLSGVQQSTDWMFRNQHEEIAAHDQRLSAAEAVLRKALTFIVTERARLRGEPRQEQGPHQVRHLHEQLPKNPNPVDKRDERTKP